MRGRVRCYDGGYVTLQGRWLLGGNHSLVFNFQSNHVRKPGKHHLRRLLQIEYSNLLDVRLVKGSEPVSTDLSTPTGETGKEGKSLVGEPVALDENKGKVHSQNGTSVPDCSKGPEAPPGIDL